MKPNLLVGDYLFVNKYVYGHSRYSFPFGLAPIQGRIGGHSPQRGDIIVFKLPSNTGIDYIKRLIGMPGDTVQMIDGHLHINGEKMPRTRLGQITSTSSDGHTSTLIEYRQTLPGGATFSIYEGAIQSIWTTPPFSPSQKAIIL